ncbi:hypothetical protein H5410_008226 [Solanum commersonii]|uniref:Uncharacterized protein n=1 Tax=Solanum commersonii TaxID=4109 RepID=A0A9J6AEL2_SOLCO|nr:hypothetical protein H5410_008226 [Solanum commersonii]
MKILGVEWWKWRGKRVSISRIGLIHADDDYQSHSSYAKIGPMTKYRGMYSKVLLEARSVSMIYILGR